MEYTDAPTIETAAETDSIPCPRCGGKLPEGAQSCSSCGWTQPARTETAEGQASDLVAVLLSVLPGLGHIYKGHRLVGLLLIFFGTPIAMGLALLAATGTAGFALLLLPIYWLAVMFHVYGIDDRIPASTGDDGEQY